MVTSTKEAAEVASEDELTDTSDGALTCRTVLSTKGKPHKTVICSSSNQKMKNQKQSRKDVLHFSETYAGNKIKTIFQRRNRITV